MAGVICDICRDAEVPAARVEIGKTHCTRQSCVNTWRQRRIADTGLTLVSVHKQGPQWMMRDEVPANDMRRQGGQW